MSNLHSQCRGCTHSMERMVAESILNIVCPTCGKVLQLVYQLHKK